MTDEMRFFLFLIERYADHKGRDGYFQYHQEAIQNAYLDIDSLVATGAHAF